MWGTSSSVDTAVKEPSKSSIVESHRGYVYQLAVYTAIKVCTRVLAPVLDYEGEALVAKAEELIAELDVDRVP